MVDFNSELKKILIKKAKGFYYKEETIEFSETRGGSQVVANSPKIKRKRGRPRKDEKPVTYFNDNQKDGVQFGQSEVNSDGDRKEDVVVKRKITTHYVPPDMLAIKMLFENFGEKVKGYEDMSDEEILLIKNQLLKELQENED